jgi:hypothetical protein
MSATVQPRPASRAGRFGLTQPMLPFVGSVIVLAIAIALQTRWVVNPDVSWDISICQRLLDGERLYVDIIETNPPFTIWLYLPAVYLANLLNVPAEYLVHGYAYAICLVGLGFAALIARRADFPENPKLYALMPAFLALLVLLPGNSFSEREQFGVALLLPLLVLMAWRASRPVVDPGLAISVLAGLTGSVIVLIKPYYAVVILAPALYVAWRRRSVLALLAPEYWAVAAAGATYVTCVMWLYPEFLRDVYPLLAETYMRIRRPLEFMLVRAAPPALTLWLLRLLLPGRPQSPLVIVLAIASLAALLPMIYQGKGWTYHLYPAIVLCLAALICRLAQAGAAGDGGRRGAASMLLVAFAAAANAAPFHEANNPDPRVVAAIRGATDRPSVGMVGSDLAVGHPLTRMVGGHWLSAYCSDWLGAFSAYLGKATEFEGNAKRAAFYEEITERYIDAKLAEFDPAGPDLLLFQKDDPFWTDRLLQRQAFATLLERDYHLLIENDAMRVYLRNGAPKMDPR